MGGRLPELDEYEYERIDQECRGSCGLAEYSLAVSCSATTVFEDYVICEGEGGLHSISMRQVQQGSLTGQCDRPHITQSLWKRIQTPALYTLMKINKKFSSLREKLPELNSSGGGNIQLIVSPILG